MRQADAIAIDSGTQHGHGAAGTSGTGGHVGRRNAQVRVEEDGSTEKTGDGGRLEVEPGSAVRRARGIERGGRCWVVGGEVEQPGDKAEDGAQGRVARARVANGFAPNAVFLS